MEDFLEGLAGGHTTELKIVLTSVVAALAVYQVILMAVGYGKVRLPFLGSKPASSTHRAVGDTIVPITLLVALMCWSYFGIEEAMADSDRQRSHALQMVGSLIVAAIIVAITIALVTAQLPLKKLPPEQREELQEERNDNSGPGS